MTVRSPRSSSGRGLRRVLLAVAVVLAGCTSGTTLAPTSTPVADPLLDIAERDGSVVVIVQLAVPRGTAASWDMTTVDRAQRRLVAAVKPGAEVIERFGRRQPMIMLRVDPAALARLRAYPKVTSISLNTADEPTE